MEKGDVFVLAMIVGVVSGMLCWDGISNHINKQDCDRYGSIYFNNVQYKCEVKK